MNTPPEYRVHTFREYVFSGHCSWQQISVKNEGYTFSEGHFFTGFYKNAACSTDTMECGKEYCSLVSGGFSKFLAIKYFHAWFQFWDRLSCGVWLGMMILFSLGAVWKFHTSRANERTFICWTWFIVRSTVKTTKQKKTQLRCGACRIKSQKKKVLRSKAVGAHMRTWSIHRRCRLHLFNGWTWRHWYVLAPVRHWVDLHRPPAFEHAKKKKK